MRGSLDRTLGSGMSFSSGRKLLCCCCSKEKILSIHSSNSSYLNTSAETPVKVRDSLLVSERPR